MTKEEICEQLRMTNFPNYQVFAAPRAAALIEQQAGRIEDLEKAERLRVINGYATPAEQLTTLKEQNQKLVRALETIINRTFALEEDPLMLLKLIRGVAEQALASIHNEKAP